VPLLAVVSCSGGDEPPAGTTSTLADVTTTAASPPPPTGPVTWPGRRDPCTLLEASDVESAVGFRVARGTTAPPELGGANSCVWVNELHGQTGGLVTLTVVPPGTDLSLDEAALVDPEVLDGLTGGARAVMGNVPDTIGPGTTGAVVTIDDGGFSIVLSTYEVREPDETERLVRAAIEAWVAQPDAP
jgi:hypothetical protein